MGSTRTKESQWGPIKQWTWNLVQGESPRSQDSVLWFAQYIPQTMGPLLRITQQLQNQSSLLCSGPELSSPLPFLFCFTGCCLYCLPNVSFSLNNSAVPRLLRILSGLSLGLLFYFRLLSSALTFTAGLASVALTGNGGGRYILPLPVPEEPALRGKTDEQPGLLAFSWMHTVIVWVYFSFVSVVMPHPSQVRKKMPAVILTGILPIPENLKSSEE